jgi:adenylosuccinate synthase
LSFPQVHAAYRQAGDRLEGFVTNTVVLLHKAMQRGASILFEGAQGTFLDIDHGTYPFVTSSNTTAGGACTGSGVPPHRMDRVIGVVKAYTTRVGEGPLPTENQEIADLLHSMGREFGATTGRPRRCGWFDAVASHHAAIINGVDELAVTNLDGLDRVETIKMCVGYQASLSRLDYVPADIELLAKCQPVYAEFPGWLTCTSHCRKWTDLPQKARSYLKAMAELTGAKLKIVSIGPARAQTIVL